MLCTQSNIRDAVASTYIMEDIWQRRDTSEFAIWRYISLREGIFRQMPGIPMSIDYDPTLRPWSVNTSFITTISLEQFDIIIIPMVKAIRLTGNDQDADQDCFKHAFEIFGSSSSPMKLCCGVVDLDACNELWCVKLTTTGCRQIDTRQQLYIGLAGLLRAVALRYRYCSGATFAVAVAPLLFHQFFGATRYRYF